MSQIISFVYCYQYIITLVYLPKIYIIHPKKSITFLPLKQRKMRKKIKKKKKKKLSVCLVLHFHYTDACLCGFSL
jgi:hypothetical protein